MELRIALYERIICGGVVGGRLQVGISCMRNWVVRGGVCHGLHIWWSKGSGLHPAHLLPRSMSPRILRVIRLHRCEGSGRGRMHLNAGDSSSVAVGATSSQVARRVFTRKARVGCDRSFGTFR